MMRFILVSVLCIQLAWCYGNQQPNGAGAFAFSDSSGNRYGGTYGLKDGEVVDVKGDFPPDLPVNYLYPDFDSFYPYYFRNFENILQEVFEYNLEQQRQALNAAKKAYDLTSNQAGYIRNYQYRFGTPGFPGFSRFNGFDPYNQEMFGSGPWMPTYSQNSAYAGAAVEPGFTHQIAAINPPNPNNPNVNKVEHYSANAGPRGFTSVSSSSFASSSTVNGKTLSHKRAETVVNNNGKITKYKVEN